MAKKKVEPIYQNWNQVDEALKAIAKIDNTLKIHESRLNDDINSIKNKTIGFTTPLLQEKGLLEENIKIYTEAHIDEFTEKKTKDFVFGQIGFRKSTEIVTRNIQAIIEALKNNRMLNCIITNEKINKEELEKYDDAALKKVGATRKSGDKYFYKINEERIESL